MAFLLVTLFILYQRYFDFVDPKLALTKNIYDYPDRLDIYRSDNPQLTHPVLVRIITDARKVRDFYLEIYVLPTPQAGTYNCPIDFFTRYLFDFYQRKKLLLHAQYDPTGCRFLQLNNKASKWTISDPEFDVHFNQLL